MGFRFDLLFDARYRVSMDGLDTTVHKVISRKEFPLYTIITVALGDTGNQIPRAYVGQ